MSSSSSTNSTSTNSRKKVVLVTTGSFNPVHSGHLEIVKLAKRRIEEQGDLIVSAILFSPSHDAYVARKMMKQHESLLFTGHERAELIELAIENDAELKGLASVDRIEIDANGFIDHPTVVEMIQQRYNELELESDDKTKVVFVAGSDLCVRLNGWQQRQLPVVVVARGDAADLKIVKGRNVIVDNNNGGREPIFEETAYAFRFITRHSQDDSVAAKASSTDVRKGELDQLPEAIRTRYSKMLASKQQKQNK